jgi:hypothetical protein
MAGLQAESPAASCLGGFSAGQLMHRNLWLEARGYDESLDRPWGWSDNDLMLRVSQHHSWLEVSSYGFFGLHMEHWPQTEERFARDPSTVNPMVIRDVPTVNGTDWGLGDVEIPTARAVSDTLPVSGPGCAVPLSGQTALPVWRSGVEAADFVRRIEADHELPPVPFEQLAAVAQVVLADLPRTVYWFGPISPAILLTICRASPAAELFFANPWPEGTSDTLPFHPGDLARFILARCRFKGWARIVQGDPATVLERIGRSSIGQAPLELAWMGFETSPVGLVRALVDRLAPGGVVLSLTDGDSAAAIERMRAATPGCVTHLLGTTGIVATTRVP